MGLDDYMIIITIVLAAPPTAFAVTCASDLSRMFVCNLARISTNNEE